MSEVQALIAIMEHPLRMADVETEDLCGRIDQLDDEALDRLLCEFHGAALTAGYTADDAGAFWYVIGLPLPYIGNGQEAARPAPGPSAGGE